MLWLSIHIVRTRTHWCLYSTVFGLFIKQRPFLYTSPEVTNVFTTKNIDKKKKVSLSNDHRFNDKKLRVNKRKY